MKVLRINLGLRLAYLEETWSSIARKTGESQHALASLARRANPNNNSLEKLGKILGVPPHELLNPKFNPRDFEKPEWKE